MISEWLQYKELQVDTYLGRFHTSPADLLPDEAAKATVIVGTLPDGKEIVLKNTYQFPS